MRFLFLQPTAKSNEADKPVEQKIHDLVLEAAKNGRYVNGKLDSFSIEKLTIQQASLQDFYKYQDSSANELIYLFNINLGDSAGRISRDSTAKLKDSLNLYSGEKRFIDSILSLTDTRLQLYHVKFDLHIMKGSPGAGNVPLDDFFYQKDLAPFYLNVDSMYRAFKR